MIVYFQKFVRNIMSLIFCDGYMEMRQVVYLLVFLSSGGFYL